MATSPPPLHVSWNRMGVDETLLDEVVRRVLTVARPGKIVISSERFEETKSIIGGIAYPAHKYGRVLYEAA